MRDIGLLPASCSSFKKGCGLGSVSYRPTVVVPVANQSVFECS